ncbi:MAG: hypothetical protein HUU01_03055 [Saprospiraceae bacterium]|nr:hypothetical protein [Saprospiraceae bacterium]
MQTNTNFLRFASICGFLTVVTTLGIHAIFPDPPADFEQRSMLYKDPLYLLNRWWVIGHCLLVLTAMWGIALLQFRKSAGFTGLGFLFFSVFAIAEISRQMLVLFYLNGLRAQYVVAETPLLKESLRMTIDQFGLTGNALFGLFILTFGLGNLCYGLGLFFEKGFGKIVSWLLILWSAGSFLALANEFWQYEGLGTFIGGYNLFFQPLVRAVMAWWLWKQASEANKTII